jgi:GNAT superfamily N-acetyltransferase
VAGATGRERRPGATRRHRVILRDAVESELHALSALAFASKAYWGYDEAFMESCRSALTLGPDDLQRYAVRVAELDGTRVGFHGVGPVAPEVYGLEWLFVAPEAIGTGAGARLLADAVAIARAAHARVLRIEADPNAEAFYVHAGARRVGEVASGVAPARALPLLDLAIA